MPGRFIVFEGIDTCGKDTQIEIAKSYMKDAIFTREPGSPLLELTQDIRKILLNPEIVVDENTECLLLASDRSCHVNYIKELLKEDKTVICSRYFYSSIAYQHYGRKIDIDNILAVNRVAINGLVPDDYIFLDIDIDTYKDRMSKKKNKDRIENFNENFFKDVIDGYHRMFHDFYIQGYEKLVPKNVHIIDGTLSIEDISKEIKKIIL